MIRWVLGWYQQLQYFDTNLLGVIEFIKCPLYHPQSACLPCCRWLLFCKYNFGLITLFPLWHHWDANKSRYDWTNVAGVTRWCKTYPLRAHWLKVKPLRETFTDNQQPLCTDVWLLVHTTCERRPLKVDPGYYLGHILFPPVLVITPLSGSNTK